jgi:hypothetical protein
MRGFFGRENFGLRWQAQRDTALGWRGVAKLVNREPRERDLPQKSVKKRGAS